jgi:cation transport ATPase
LVGVDEHRFLFTLKATKPYCFSLQQNIIELVEQLHANSEERNQARSRKAMNDSPQAQAVDWTIPCFPACKNSSTRKLHKRQDWEAVQLTQTTKEEAAVFDTVDLVQFFFLLFALAHNQKKKPSSTANAILRQSCKSRKSEGADSQSAKRKKQDEEKNRASSLSFFFLLRFFFFSRLFHFFHFVLHQRPLFSLSLVCCSLTLLLVSQESGKTKTNSQITEREFGRKSSTEKEHWTT